MQTICSLRQFFPICFFLVFGTVGQVAFNSSQAQVAIVIEDLIGYQPPAQPSPQQPAAAPAKAGVYAGKLPPSAKTANQEAKGFAPQDWTLLRWLYQWLSGLFN